MASRRSVSTVILCQDKWITAFEAKHAEDKQHLAAKHEEEKEADEEELMKLQETEEDATNAERAGLRASQEELAEQLLKENGAP